MKKEKPVILLFRAVHFNYCLIDNKSKIKYELFMVLMAAQKALLTAIICVSWHCIAAPLPLSPPF